MRDRRMGMMACGRLPLSLLHWEITGLGDEVRQFGARQPIPAE